MKASLLCLGAAALLAITACNSSSKAGASASADSSSMNAFATQPKAGANYGAGVSTKAKPMPYSAFIAEVNSKDSVKAVVTGTVLEVCQKKGCWMTLQPESGDSKMSVRFKDYSFFMPKTLSGNKVIVEGLAKRTEVSVADLRHYAEDAGKSKAEIASITEPQVEIELMATGVRVL